MAVQYINFAQPVSSPMQFLATLDGSSYTIAVPWNLWGQRYYLTVTTVDGVLVLNIPLIGSTLTNNINLLAGYFTTSTLVWRVDNKQFELGP